MEKYDVYQDIAKRTDGDVYVGVVGPVRTGKSTFVRRFTEIFVLPNIVGRNKKKIAVDEMPQSGDGNTITTTEPKFVPAEGIKVSFGGKTTVRMRLIDCVGFVVEGALGHEENGSPRLVKTPWSDQPLPFKEAAEKGTEKVISDHSTIGIIVTADGSFTDIPRENYIPAEEKSVAKLKELGKPFTIVLNSADPRGEKCRELAEELKQKYGAPVVALNALTDGEEKFNEVMESVLYGFPLKTADIDLPDWLKAMPPESKVIGEIIEAVKRAARKAESMRDCSVFEEETAAVEKIIPEKLTVYAGEGRAKLLLAAEKSLFYDVLSEAAGENIDGEYKLMRLVSDLSEKKKQYERVGEAVEEARATGYGVVVPDFSDMTVGEPELVRKGTGYTVRITAEAESMHLVKVSVRGRVNPLSGTKKQCEDFLEYLKTQTEEVGAANANIFGRPLNRLVSDEMNMKASAMPADTRKKVRRSVAKMVNEGKYKIFYIVY